MGTAPEFFCGWGLGRVFTVGQSWFGGWAPALDVCQQALEVFWCHFLAMRGTQAKGVTSQVTRLERSHCILEDRDSRAAMYCNGLSFFSGGGWVEKHLFQPARHFTVSNTLGCFCLRIGRSQVMPKEPKTPMSQIPPVQVNWPDYFSIKSHPKRAKGKQPHVLNLTTIGGLLAK